MLRHSGVSYDKLLPNHSQMKEDDEPEKLPCFGQDLDESAIPVKNDLELEAERILQEAPALQPNDDSFSMLHPADEVLEAPKEESRPAAPARDELKESMIKEADVSHFFANGSFVFDQKALNIMNTEGVDEYQDDDDPGFDAYLVSEANFVESCRELASQYNYPARAIKPETDADLEYRTKVRAQQAIDEPGLRKKLMQKDDSAVLLKST